jgi:hypothetical protein
MVVVDMCVAQLDGQLERLRVGHLRNHVH